MVRTTKFVILLVAASAACISADSYSFSSTDVSQNDNAAVKPADPAISTNSYNGNGKPTMAPTGDSSTSIHNSPANGNDSPVQKEVPAAPTPSNSPATPTTDSSTQVTQAPAIPAVTPATPASPAATPAKTSTGTAADTTPKATPASTATGKATGSTPSATPASTSTGSGRTKPPCPTLPQPDMNKTKPPCPTLPQPDMNKTKPPCPTLPQPNLPAVTPAASATKAASADMNPSQIVLEANTKSAATRVVPALAAVVVSAVYLLL